MLLGTLTLLLAADAQAARNVPDEAAALEIGQNALGRTLPDLDFITADGRKVSLADFGGKPLLINLVYTACTDICPTIIESLRPALEIAQEALGKERFATVTVGFDARHDTPDRMRSFARQHGADLPAWDFLSSDQKTVDALADAVGFTFYPSAGGFEHMALVSVVDGNGRLYRQVYGGIFEPPAIVEPLKDLVFGRTRPLSSIDGIIDRVRLFCTIYDPTSGRYYFDYSMFIGIAIGLACLGSVAAFLLSEWRRSKAAS